MVELMDEKTLLKKENLLLKEENVLLKQRIDTLEEEKANAHNPETLVCNFEDDIIKDEYYKAMSVFSQKEGFHEQLNW